MTVSLDWYSDSGLTTPIDADTLVVAERVDGSTSPVTKQVHLGSTVADRKFEVAANPGVDNIVLTLVHSVAEWAASTAYVVDNEVRTTAHNGYVYKCTTAGTTGASEPTWPTTIGATVADGTVVWECVRKTHEPEEVELSLDGSTWQAPGAALDLGVVEILSGTAGAVAVHLRFDDATEEVATLTEITLQSQELQETSTA